MDPLLARIQSQSSYKLLARKLLVLALSLLLLNFVLGYFGFNRQLDLCVCVCLRCECDLFKLCSWQASGKTANGLARKLRGSFVGQIGFGGGGGELVERKGEFVSRCDRRLHRHFVDVAISLICLIP